MKGGQITGNRTSDATAGTVVYGDRTYATTAGVFLYNGLFDMSGGSITDNSYSGSDTRYDRNDYDVRITTGITGTGFSIDNPSNPQFELSGDAQIGSVIFTLARNTTMFTSTTPHIQLADNFTGSVSALNFDVISSSTQENVTRNAWTSSEPIRYFITGPGATEANISKFTMGIWLPFNPGTITSHVPACNPGEGIYLKAK
jgi:hypothetical protein